MAVGRPSGSGPQAVLPKPQAVLPKPQALLFDLGGVVLNIDFGRSFEHWAAASGVAAGSLRERFSMDAVFERYERGEIDQPEYFEHLRTQLRLSLGDAALHAGWVALFDGEVAGIHALLAAGAERLPTYAFSNTNAAHVHHFSGAHAQVLTHFNEVFVSCELGTRKPETASFEAVSHRMGVPLTDILFFDDLAANVSAAGALGMQAVLVRSTADVRTALEGAFGCSLR